MTRAKKILLVFLIILIVSQIPFAYRRYKLGRLNAEIQSINGSRRPKPSNERFLEYTGVIHVHSFLGGHTTGRFSDIISAAKANGLRFVIMTEHVEQDLDTADMTLKGQHAGVLFVNGNEVQTSGGERLLIVPGDSSLTDAGKTALIDVVKRANSRGSLVVAAYPEEYKNLTIDGVDAIEVFNLFTNARQIKPLFAVFDVLWSKRSYPDLLFATFYSRPTEALNRWDEALGHKRLVAVGGNDAHNNIGFTLNSSSGNPILGMQLDPYETSFRIVRLHVLIPQGQSLATNTLIEAIKAGHSFIGFDVFGDTSGFSFTAENATGMKLQGDEISLPAVKLKVEIPVESRVVLYKDGRVLRDDSGVSTQTYEITERGVYRTEVYLPRLGKPIGEQPWIISNPIFVK